MSRLWVGRRESGADDARPGARGADEQRVEVLLRALAVEDARVTPPLRLEAAVMEAWATHRPRTTHRAWDGPWIPRAWRVAAIVVAIVVAIAAIDHSLPGRRGATVTSPTTPSTAVSPAAALAADAGVPLVADPLAEPTALNVMRVRMSRSALADLGLPILDPDAAGVVDVEVLVGEDGVARSIRRAAFAVIEE